MIAARIAFAIGLFLLAACSSASEPKVPIWTTYPEPLRGNWMPQDMKCPFPINYDSDALVVISETVLNNYEESSKPVRVTSIKLGPPSVWSIDSYLNVSGDGYDTKISEVFVITGGQLLIADKENLKIYHRCK